MCVNCMSNAEALGAQIGIAAFILKRPVHQLLANVGLAPEPDPVAHDVRTVSFLRSLDLDPVEILGAPAVAAAERWMPRPAFEFPWSGALGVWRRPILNGA
jgi:hypothetical protein